MDNKIILMVVVAIVLGMLVANMFKDVCGCKVVEGQSRPTGYEQCGSEVGECQWLHDGQSNPDWRDACGRLLAGVPDPCTSQDLTTNTFMVQMPGLSDAQEFQPDWAVQRYGAEQDGDWYNSVCCGQSSTPPPPPACPAEAETCQPDDYGFTARCDATLRTDCCCACSSGGENCIWKWSDDDEVRGQAAATLAPAGCQVGGNCAGTGVCDDIYSGLDSSAGAADAYCSSNSLSECCINASDAYIEFRDAAGGGGDQHGDHSNPGNTNAPTPTVTAQPPPSDARTISFNHEGCLVLSGDSSGGDSSGGH